MNNIYDHTTMNTKLAQSLISGIAGTAIMTTIMLIGIVVAMLS
jgi:hypothetical protein